ncbi:MAG: GDSL-type esterase/lipase family protein [Gammaproteobacteria bacterium]|nr:GDSL-type esterase/lipase family protein [Gammaproteobacteria bacterium]MDH5799235.1 GDSL-type esterase/lipase family protein [Gammaproteobacteria bacterium]
MKKAKNRYRYVDAITRHIVTSLICVCCAQNAIGSPSQEKIMQEEKSVQNPGKSIVIMGASYAKSWGVQSIAGYKVINKGQGGQQTAEVLDRFQADVVALKPRAVLLWGFINDIFRAGQKDRTELHQDIQRNIESMVELSQKNGIEPILVSEVTIPKPSGLMNQLKGLVGKILGKKSYQDKINEQVILLNQWLLSLGKQKNLLVLDFHRELAADDGSRKINYTQEDGSHISESAYERLTQYVFAEEGRIAQHLENRK